MRRRQFVVTAAVSALAAATGAFAVARPRVVKVVAKRFQFMPARIMLKKGEPVVFELTSQDVMMGMNIPDFGVRSDIIPGKTLKLAFTPDKAGTFIFLCDVFCGDGHEGMNGTLVVT